MNTISPNATGVELPCNDPRGDPWLMTHPTRRRVSLNNPTPEQIDIADIANALGNICRFGGHVPRFFSVAQHSIHVAYIASLKLARTPCYEDWTMDQRRQAVVLALMHDAAEAYTGDLPTPLKLWMGERFARLERGVCSAIDSAGLSGTATDSASAELVGQCDRSALWGEAVHLLRINPTIEWDMDEPGLWLDAEMYENCWPGEVAGEAFLELWRLLVVDRVYPAMVDWDSLLGLRPGK